MSNRQERKKYKELRRGVKLSWENHFTDEMCGLTKGTVVDAKLDNETGEYVFTRTPLYPDDVMVKLSPNSVHKPVD